MHLDSEVLECFASPPSGRRVARRKRSSEIRVDLAAAARADRLSVEQLRPASPAPIAVSNGVTQRDMSLTERRWCPWRCLGTGRRRVHGL
jgi:hypothetical protein